MHAESTREQALPPGAAVLWYEVEALLGAGPYGYTYLARDLQAHDPGPDLPPAEGRVVVRELLPAALARRAGGATVRAHSAHTEMRYAEARRRFMHEAERLAGVRHPGVVRVRFPRRAHGTAYMVMEWLAGETLESWLRHPDGLGEQRLLKLMLPVIDGLQAVHEAGAVHGALGPRSIRLRADGAGVVLGFAAARQYWERGDAPLPDWLPDGYAPPEQYHAGRQAAAVSGDVYGLCALLYRLVSGRAPPDARQRRVAREDPLRPAREVAAGRYSRALLDAIDAGLALDPAARPPDMRSLRHALLGPPGLQQDSRDTRTPVLRRHVPAPRLAVMAGWLALFGMLYAASWVAWHTRTVHALGGWLFGAPAPPDVAVSPPPVADPAAVARSSAAAGPRSPEDGLQEPSLAGVLADAARAMASQRFTTPAHDNAFDRYLAVLVRSPDSAEALRGIDGIIDAYAERAHQAAAAGDLDRAASMRTRAELVVRSALGEVALRPGARLWLEDELERVLALPPDGPPRAAAASGDEPRSPSAGAAQRLRARAQRLLAEARTAEQGGRRERALALYTTVLGLRPADEEALDAIDRLGTGGDAGEGTALAAPAAREGR